MLEIKRCEKLLSICITSYNRISELERCIRSIETGYSNLIEIVVSEDHSELRNEIRAKVDELKNDIAIDIIFNSNEINLGYDRNLNRLISLSSGKYVLFLSDDDSLIEKSLDTILEILSQDEYNMLFSPFVFGKEFKRYYSRSCSIEKGIISVNRYIYDSILFSGLVFRREYIKDISAERFLNCNYFQVYLFMYIMLHFQTNYINVPLVKCNGDGENAFGKAASSNGNELLADRNSVFSNIEFHRGLIKVINIFEMDFDVKIIPSFAREYCLRAFQGMSNARSQGFYVYKKYWACLKTLEIPFSIIIYLYHIMLIVFGSNVSNFFVTIPKYLLKKSRV